jgi:hypothetical protein
MGVTFFALTVWAAVSESTSPPKDVPLWTALKTVFAFLGGSGVTAWLSMSIYEFITSRNQERGWKHAFDVDKVRETYGPIYDEMRMNIERLSKDFSKVDPPYIWKLQRQYMALLVPNYIIQKGNDFLLLADEYNGRYDQATARLDNIVNETVRDYIVSSGGPSLQRIAFSSGVWKYVLGATNPQFKKNYDMLLSFLEEKMKESKLQLENISDFEKKLRASLLQNADAEELLSLRHRLIQKASDMLAKLSPLIRAPYKL